VQRYTLVFTMQTYIKEFSIIIAFISHRFCICLLFKPLMAGRFQNIFEGKDTFIYIEWKGMILERIIVVIE
jgi:hypothetical protein